MVAPEILVPGLVLTALWPILRVALAREVDAFRLAFLVTIALCLAIQAEVLILTARRRLGPRAAVLAILCFGPGLLTFLVLTGAPSWCQHFLSGYFLVMAALFTRDLIDGKAHLARHNWPELIQPDTCRILGQMMVFKQLGMFLANEMLIFHASLGNWLICLGYAPLFSHLVEQSTLAVLRDLAARRCKDR